MNNYLDLSPQELTEKYRSQKIEVNLLSPEIRTALQNHESPKRLTTAILFLFNIRVQEPQFVSEFQSLLELIPIKSLSLLVVLGSKTGNKRHRRRPHYLALYAKILMSQNVSDLDIDTLIKHLSTTESVLFKKALLEKILSNSTEKFPSKLLHILNYEGFLSASLASTILGRSFGEFECLAQPTHSQYSDILKYAELVLPFVLKNLSHPNLNIRVSSMHLIGLSGRAKLFEHIIPFLYSKEYYCTVHSNALFDGVEITEGCDYPSGIPVSYLAVTDMLCLDEKKSIPHFLNILQESPMPVHDDSLDPRVRILSFLDKNNVFLEVLSEKLLKSLLEDSNKWISRDALIMLDKLYKSENNPPVEMEQWLKAYAKNTYSGGGHGILRYLYGVENAQNPEVVADFEMRARKFRDV